MISYRSIFSFGQGITALGVWCFVAVLVLSLFLSDSPFGHDKLQFESAVILNFQSEYGIFVNSDG